ncbi:Myb/SANT-like domain, harbinger transposase-derived nuclease domain protein [Tanacetum coccineum]
MGRFKAAHKRAHLLAMEKPLPYRSIEIVFQSISLQWCIIMTNTGQEFGASASVSAASGASTSGASASGASAIREHVGALNMDDDPLVDVAVAVDDDDDDDDGNSRAHKIQDEVRPKKKTKTSRVTMDDLMVDMQCALKHMVKTTDGPTTEQCYVNGYDALLLIWNLMQMMQVTDVYHLGLGYILIRLVRVYYYDCYCVAKQGVVCDKEIIIPTNFNLNPTVPSHNRRLRQIFKGAVGALGIAHDSRILSEAIRNQNAPFPLPPPDKYYLCDAAYAHTRGFMAPYHNVRYWLGDFRQRRPLNSKEKFNHSHAKLRNMIERAYGVLKALFPILKRMAPFSLTTQRNITIACFALHNFIRKEGLDDELFSTCDQSNVQLDNENILVEDDGGIEEDEVQPQENASNRQYLTNLRDQIAQQLMQSG